MQTSGGESLLRDVIRSFNGSYIMLSDVLNGPAAITALNPPTAPSHITYCIIFSWLTTMWRPAIVIVCTVHLSVCHMRISPKLSEIDVWLLGNSNRNPGSRFTICHQIRDRKYGSAIWVFPGWHFSQSDRNQRE